MIATTDLAHVPAGDPSRGCASLPVRSSGGGLAGRAGWRPCARRCGLAHERTAPRPLSTALETLTATLAPATTLARVQEIWEARGGAGDCRRGRSPTGERDGVLTVTCAAAVWAQELDLMAAELILRLNAALGDEAIRELRCRTG